MCSYVSVRRILSVCVLVCTIVYMYVYTYIQCTTYIVGVRRTLNTGMRECTRVGVGVRGYTWVYVGAYVCTRVYVDIRECTWVYIGVYGCRVGTW